MEKTLKITPPEGYEIDIEKSIHLDKEYRFKAD